MLDLHAMVAGRWPDDGRVGGQGGRQALRSAWEKLADTFCDADQYWHVFAADLKNEVCNEIGPLSHSTTEQGVLLGVGVLFVE